MDHDHGVEICCVLTQSNSVLSVFSLSLLADVQRPTLTMHSLSRVAAVVMSSRQQCRYNCVSSANEWRVTPCRLTMSERVCGIRVLLKLLGYWSYCVVDIIICWLLAECYSFTFGYWHLSSFCRLSVTLMLMSHTQRVELFCNIFAPYCSLAIRGLICTRGCVKNL